MLAHVFGRQVFVDMLGRKNDLRDADRLAADILHGHLALGVRAELDRVAVAGLAGLREDFENLVRVIAAAPASGPPFRWTHSRT